MSADPDDESVADHTSKLRKTHAAHSVHMTIGSNTHADACVDAGEQRAATSSSYPPVWEASALAIQQDDLNLGERLAEKMREVCESNAHFSGFLKDPSNWGVVLESDSRFTGPAFGDYKSEKRLETEAVLLNYMCEPSLSRAHGVAFGSFTIAVTLAPPGTGKSRLIDDAMRMPLASASFEHFLPLAITFNGNMRGAYHYPISVRLLRQFFCGNVSGGFVVDLMRGIDDKLVELFKDKGEDEVARSVVGAIEALYFHQRDGKLGRTVLMVDEISKVKFKITAGNDTLFRSVAVGGVDAKHVPEQSAYRIIVGIVDGAPLTDTRGRRGAVFTALNYMEPLSEMTVSRRDLLWLPLGKFDVWSSAPQEAITGEARRFRGLVNGKQHFLLEDGQEIAPRVWCLLAATGERPRDILTLLERLHLNGVELVNPASSDLWNVFKADVASTVFQPYLLPSMMSMPFPLFTSVSGKRRLTQFGVDASDPALLNVDQLADTVFAIPAVSLLYRSSLAAPALATVKALVEATAFCGLAGTGKDFEHVWVLLVFTHLLLQHSVRVCDSMNFFWPEGVLQVDLQRPTAVSIQVFQSPGQQRVDSLFIMPVSERICNDAQIQRKIMFAAELPPKLAIWDNLWVPVVRPGGPVDGWAMATFEVVWRPSTVVYFSEVTHLAIDFMLLVGDANGTGDVAPHVYVFQCKGALTIESVIVDLETQLGRLFSDEFAGHVLRGAGIASRAQVTLCINALQFGARVDVSKLVAPFSVVLFDEEDFCALGGAAFANTRFFRFLAQRSK